MLADLKAEPIGNVYTTTNESTFDQLIYSTPSALRVVVVTSPPNGSNERLWLDFVFFGVAGLRLFDDPDLHRFFASPSYKRGYRLYRIDAGGWRDQERETPGMLGVTGAIPLYKEWFVCTTNRCANVMASKEPRLTEGKW